MRITRAGGETIHVTEPIFTGYDSDHKLAHNSAVQAVLLGEIAQALWTLVESQKGQVEVETDPQIADSLGRIERHLANMASRTPGSANGV